MIADRLEEHIAAFTAPVAHLSMTKRMQGVIRDLAIAAWMFDWRDRPGTVFVVDDNDGIPRLSVTVPAGPDGEAAVTLQADVAVSVPAREQVRDLIWDHVRSELDAKLTFGSERSASSGVSSRAG
jgi:hypothetical protein